MQIAQEEAAEVGLVDMLAGPVAWMLPLPVHPAGAPTLLLCCALCTFFVVVGWTVGTDEGRRWFGAVNHTTVLSLFDSQFRPTN